MRNSLFKQYQIGKGKHTEREQGKRNPQSLIADASTVDSKAWTTGVG